MRNEGLWNRVLDRALVAGFTLVILGLVSVQLFGVMGLADAFGPRDPSAAPLDLQSTSGIVAPVLRADLGGEAEAEPQGLRASLWLAPIASLRGGFGLGWMDLVDSGPGLAGGHRELRLRLGGGLMAPLTPSMGVDLHASA